MDSFIVPVLIFFGFVGLYLVTALMNSKIDPPEEIELIDCEDCANTKCTIRKRHFAVRKEDKDPNCHYMPFHKINKK